VRARSLVLVAIMPHKDTHETHAHDHSHPITGQERHHGRVRRRREPVFLPTGRPWPLPQVGGSPVATVKNADVPSISLGNLMKFCRSLFLKRDGLRLPFDDGVHWATVRLLEREKTLEVQISRSRAALAPNVRLVLEQPDDAMVMHCRALKRAVATARSARFTLSTKRLDLNRYATHVLLVIGDHDHEDFRSGRRAETLKRVPTSKEAIMTDTTNKKAATTRTTKTTDKRTKRAHKTTQRTTVTKTGRTTTND
jgi:hypothetical protein